jgi:hypothetical protein
MDLLDGSVGEAWFRENLEGYAKRTTCYLFHEGSPKWGTSPSITHRCGLRKGDPLSPMLFILVMEALNLLIAKAAKAGLLQPLSFHSIQHRLSLYADDVVLFLRLTVSDIHITTIILQLFGEASGLKTNISKSNVPPIQCSNEEIEVVQEHLPCRVEHFLVKYPGLPLSIKRLTKPFTIATFQ